MTTVEQAESDVGELSQKLMDGWTLLSESCSAPGCKVPLVRSPDHSRTLCVSCLAVRHLSLGREGGAVPGQGGEVAAGAPSGASRGADGMGETSLKGWGSLLVNGADEEDGGELDSHPLSDGEKSGARVGRMYSDPLRAIPREKLLEQGEDGVEGGAHIMEEDQGGALEMGGEEMEEESWKAAMTSRMAQPGDSSGRIAERLLQGWTLLNEHCPQCLTPLMRSRGGGMWCTTCDMRVVTEEEAAHMSQKRKGEEDPGAGGKRLAPKVEGMGPLDGGLGSGGWLGSVGVGGAAAVLGSSGGGEGGEGEAWGGAVGDRAGVGEAAVGVDGGGQVSDERGSEGEGGHVEDDSVAPVMDGRGGGAGRGDGKAKAPASDETKAQGALGKERGLGLPMEVEMAGLAGTMMGQRVGGGSFPPVSLSKGGLRLPAAEQGKAMKGLDTVVSATVESLVWKLDELRALLDECHDVMELRQVMAAVTECTGAITALEGLGNRIARK